MANDLNRAIELLVDINQKLDNISEDITIGGDQIDVTSISTISANMGLVTAGILRSPNFESGVQGYEINGNTELAEFGNVIVRGEMQTTAMTTNIESSTAGTFVVSGATGILINDVKSTDTTIDIRYADLSVDQFIFFKPNASRLEWMRITSAATPITGGYRYSVTRDLDGTGANQFYAGETCASRGIATDPQRSAMWAENDTVTGQWGTSDMLWAGTSSSARSGWVVLEGGSDSSGPHLAIFVRTGAQYNNYETRGRFGKLANYLDYSANATDVGFAAGDTGDFISWDATNGLRLEAGNNKTKIDGSYILIPSLTTTERNNLSASNGMLIYNTTDNKFQGYENGAWANLI